MQTLFEIYSKHCSNSTVIGGDKGTVHSYINKYYESALADYRTTANKILEIGINNGHSLYMWSEYFLNHTEIIGVDINEFIPPPDLNCTIIKGDATQESTFDNIADLDVIIDDGSHEFKHQMISFKILFPRLKPGGIYIIEDIKNIDKNQNRFLGLYKDVKIYDFREISGISDDVIVEIKK
jgi:23S rRNA U2552 (ribose-2'-O)-methylase RlmE/FtsJ